MSSPSAPNHGNPPATGGKIPAEGCSSPFFRTR